MEATTQTETHTGTEHEVSEGRMTREIERRTADMPSTTYLWAALGSMAASATLQLMGRKDESLFVGQWAPSFLLLGVYNKIVKVEGSDSD